MGLRPIPQIIKVSNSQSVLIPQTANTETILLIAVVPAYIAVIVAHGPGPGVKGTVLGSTPPETVVTFIAEISIVAVTVATRKG